LKIEVARMTKVKDVGDLKVVQEEQSHRALN
jgi:hypothetical protein